MEVPTQEPQNAKTNGVFMSLMDIDGKLFSDQTGNFPSYPVEATNMLSSFTCLMPTLCSPTQSKTDLKTSCCERMRRCMSISQIVDTNQNYTKQTTKHHVRSRHLLQSKMSHNNLHHRKCTEPIQQKEEFRLGKFILFQVYQAYRMVFQSNIGANSCHRPI